MDLDSIIALGREAIPGDSATGGACRYEPEFEALDAEISKLEAIGGGEVAWHTVVSTASELLRGKSKDILVGAYLTAGLFEQSGMPGLAAGLSMLDGLCQNWWQDLFPPLKRMRARQGAFSWLAERMQTRLEGSSGHDPAAAQEALESLRNLLADKMEGDDGLGMLVRSLRECASTAPTAAAPEAPATDSTASPTAVAPAPAGPIASREEAFRRLEEVGEYLRRTEPHSPIGYLLQRAVNLSKLNFNEVYQKLLPDDRNAMGNLRLQLGLDDDED